MRQTHCVLRGLSEWPGNIPRDVEHLDLSWGELTAVPDSIAGLTGLRSLDLSHNQLARLPDALAQLPQLRVLDVSHNQLTWLPDALAGAGALVVIMAGHNPLCGVPEWLQRRAPLTCWCGCVRDTPCACREWRNAVWHVMARDQWLYGGPYVEDAQDEDEEDEWDDDDEEDCE